MIGNDVVDRCDPDAESASYSPRFDERVFAPSEKRILAQAADSETHRWLIWAAKEAAYKAHRKIEPNTFFSPKNFEVELSETAPECAVVNARTEPGAVFEVRFFLDGSAIHAVALYREWVEADVVHGCDRMTLGHSQTSAPETPSRAVRRFALERLASVLGRANDELEIRKEGRIPFLFENGRRVIGNLSLSHHGQWLAFAFEQDGVGGERRS